MDSFDGLFRRIKTAYDRRPRRDAALVCKEGFYRGSHVLKLQKATWTNDDMRTVPNQTGIFFSVWFSDDENPNRSAIYNIHALKLRQLRGYKITSRDFAAKFRQRFEKFQQAWPNVSVEYGPQTLMQGWIEISARSGERDVLRLMHRFEKIAPIIDDLLANHNRLISNSR